MLEFKLNYYFEKYKDTCIVSVTKFKEKFIKKEGEFELLNELCIMIQRYQYDKYGNLVTSGRKLNTNVKKGTYNNLENNRVRHRLGTKREREIRKLNERWCLK